MLFDNVYIASFGLISGIYAYDEHGVLQALRAEGHITEGMTWEQENVVLAAFLQERNLAVYAAPADTFSVYRGVEKAKMEGKFGVVCDNLS